MIFIALQFFLAVLSLACAILIKRNSGSSNRRSWTQMMHTICEGNSHLAALSFGCPFSEGKDCEVHELWQVLGGKRGVYAIYSNTQVIVEALGYIEKHHVHSADLNGTIETLRHDSFYIRALSVFLIGRQSLRWLLGDSDGLLDNTVEEYLALVAKFSHLLNDNFPELVSEYLEAMGTL